MVGVRKRGEEIRKFLVESIPDHPSDIAYIAAEQFGISRQAAQKHLRKLEKQKLITASGSTKARRYVLTTIAPLLFTYSLSGLDEAQVWRNDIAESLSELPDNVLDIWHYGITEIVNNAIDHSEGTNLAIHIGRDAQTSTAYIVDNGEGIFLRIARLLGLEDPRHSVLELAKGKLTTDPSRHSGEGIFFSSRLFDEFHIMSQDISFAHHFGRDDDWVLVDRNPKAGTAVVLRLANNSARLMKTIFDEYASGDDYGFTKTVVPVALAQYGDDKLVSRSQAKRLLNRFDRFQSIILDFEGVETIGQSFADEVFRVFVLEHPEILLRDIRTTEQISQMIARARASLAIDLGGIGLSSLP